MKKPEDPSELSVFFDVWGAVRRFKQWRRERRFKKSKRDQERYARALHKPKDKDEI